MTKERWREYALWAAAMLLGIGLAHGLYTVAWWFTDAFIPRLLFTLVYIFIVSGLIGAFVRRVMGLIRLIAEEKKR